MESVSNALQLQLVLAQVDLVDLDHGQSVGSPGRAADQLALFVEVESVVEIFAAQVERLADQLGPEIVFLDGVDFGAAGFGGMGRGRRGVRGGRAGWRLGPQRPGRTRERTPPLQSDAEWERRAGPQV